MRPIPADISSTGCPAPQLENAQRPDELFCPDLPVYGQRAAADQHAVLSGCYSADFSTAVTAILAADAEQVAGELNKLAAVATANHPANGHDAADTEKKRYVRPLSDAPLDTIGRSGASSRSWPAILRQARPMRSARAAGGSREPQHARSPALPLTVLGKTHPGHRNAWSERPHGGR